MGGVYHLSSVCIAVIITLTIVVTANQPAFAGGGGCTIYLTERGSCLALNTTAPAGKVLTHVANKQACKNNVNTFPGSTFESLGLAVTVAAALPRGCNYASNKIIWNEGGRESKTSRSFCCIAKAKSGDYEVAPDRWKVQFDYNIASAVYTNLNNYIKDIKRRGMPLLIKINSHPCAGKSYFISQHSATKRYHGLFMGVRLLDYDGQNGSNKTSSLLLRMTNNTALLGSAVFYPGKEKNGVNEGAQRFDGVVYIHVIPTLEQIRLQIKRRQEIAKNEFGQDPNVHYWMKAENILIARTKAIALVFQNGVQVEPVFNTFEEGLKYCVDAYTQQ
eukprot:gene14052-32841_t